MTNIVELRPDKELINSQFEKYQFCTDGISITSEIVLEKEVFRLEPNSNQESWLEARLFAFHNHLFKNPYDTSCWFIDKDWVVWRLNKILKVKGTVEYACIEENGNHLHSICQDSMLFEDLNAKVEKHNLPNLEEKEEIKIPKYCWSQDEDSITVWIKVEEQQYKQARINCQHRLDESLTTWKYEHGTLQLELMKFENGLMWNELIKGDTGGECLPNQALAAEIHSRLAHLCTDQPNSQRDGQPCIGFNAEQLEECDLEARDNLLQRVNLATQATTHLSMLGINNHVLFTYKKKSGQAICLRHDHDGCVWETVDTIEDQWGIKHICTFPGFGYVEASKSNKKFCVSPPDGSYVAILEHTRHIFLYEKPQLNTKIGKQWIVDLGHQMHPIMGVVATNEYLIILTKDKLYRLQIYR
ncbi:hypothetical protein KM043_018045 [Ampulex compressa]|nr:hypothetical protein KM043_018045 [Ampulex compressa]